MAERRSQKNGSNKEQALHGMQFLTGEETAVFSDGTADNVLRFHFNSLKQSCLREALFIFTPAETRNPAYLQGTFKQLAKSHNVNVIGKNIKFVENARKHQIGILERHNDYWQMPLAPGSLPKLREHALNLRNETKQKVDLIPNSLVKLTAFAKQGRLGLSAKKTSLYERMDNPSYAFGNALDQEHFHELVDTLNAQTDILTAPILKYLQLRQYPIIIRDNFRINGFSYSISESGLLFDASFISDLESSSPEQKFEAKRVMARLLISAVIYDYIPPLHMLGIDKPEEWKKVAKEINGPAQALLPDDVKAHDAAIANDYTPLDVIAFMHSWLHAGQYAPQEIRQMLPASAALYDRFIGWVNERNGYLEHSIGQLQGIKRLPSSSGKGLPKPPQPLTDVRSSRSSFNPIPFTDKASEAEMIAAVKLFVESALQEKPPYNQCKCRLVLNDKMGPGGYPVEVVLRNEKREDKAFLIPTQTDDLAVAISLKKALQSHLLSHPEIMPLWMSRLQQAEHHPVLPMDEVLPQAAPVEAKLVDHCKFFEAEFTFKQKDLFGRAVDVTARIPLGLEYKPMHSAYGVEAIARMERVKERLDTLVKTGRWETVGEVSQDLKQWVRETERPLGWRIAQTMPVEHYSEKGKIDLGFPAQGGQYTRIVGASLRLENGPKHPNPSWRLSLRVEIGGVNSEPLLLQPTMNLHTEDGVAAQLRAIETIESLIGNVGILAHKHPEKEWVKDEEGNLVIRDALGRTPRDPEPQNFMHLHDDMVHFKSNFQVRETAAQRRHENGRVYVTLHIERGTLAENDLVMFKNLAGKPMTLTFSVAEREGNRIGESIDAVNTTFQRYIQDAYSNRTENTAGETVRKVRQEFRTSTIENLLYKAFESDREYGVLETVRPSFARANGAIVDVLEEGANRGGRRRISPDEMRKRDAEWDGARPV